MSKAYVPRALRERVALQAQHRCGYCLTPQHLCGMMLTIEHLLPEARGGSSEEDNLWLACMDCNEYKGDRIEAEDTASGETVRLFDPRHQQWSEHFVWTSSGTVIVGRTPTGRATIVALKLNREILVEARSFWVRLGEHPPTS